MTIEEFGKTIKSKYPDYNNLTDFEVGSRMLSKYPQYSSAVSGPAAVQESQQPSFLNRLKQRAMNLQTGIEAQQKGQQTFPETLLQRVGFGAGLVNEAASSALSPITNATDALGNLVGEGAKRIFSPIINSPQAQQLSQFAKNTQIPGGQQLGNIQNYLSNTPQGQRISRDVGAVGDIAMAVPTVLGATELASRGIGVAKGAIEKRAATAGDRAFQGALDVTKPQLSKKETISAFEKAGQPGGLEKSGLLGTYGVSPTQKANDIAKSVQGIVSPNKGPYENLVALNKSIEDQSLSLRTALSDNPSPFNMKTLQSKLNKIEPPLIISSDSTLNNTYKNIVNSFTKVAQQFPKTMNGLWDARIAFDKMIEGQFGETFWDQNKNSVAKQALSDVRRTVNSYIDESTGGAFKSELSDLANKYEARSIISEKNYKLENSNIITRGAGQHPLAARAIMAGVGTVAGALGLKGLKDYLGL